MKIKEFFILVDNDHDGLISKINMNLANINEEFLK